MDTNKHLAATHNGDARDNGDGAAAQGTARDDSEITARIKSALGALPDHVALRVGVDTRNGIVTLTRSVESRTQTEMAIAIAARTPGVKYVNDHLIATARRLKPGIRMPGSAAFLGSDGASDV